MLFMRRFSDMQTSSPQLGLRVIRGRDWQWDDQDGGEGQLGTVVQVFTNAADIVLVRWDHGTQAFYRAGRQQAYDLRIFDSGPCGIRNAGVQCSECSTEDFFGQWWQCSECPYTNLCSRCYHSDKHDISHSFWWNDYCNETSSKCLAPRQQSRKVSLSGIIPGAKVTRGRDWCWGDQDGEGGVGQVVSVRGWEAETGNSVAEVVWQGSSVIYQYRVGHKGKVDLQSKQQRGDHLDNVTPCYIDHLPVFAGIRDTHSTALTGSDSTLLPAIRLSQQKMDERAARKAILNAAKHCRLDTLALLLNCFPNQINGRCNGKSAIMLAAHQGHLKVLQFLLSRGADLSACDRNGHSALHFAVEGRQQDSVSLILSAGASVDCRNYKSLTPLHLAAYLSDVECIKVLLDHHAKVSARDHDGSTALHLAVLNTFSRNAFHVLLSAPDADLGQCDQKGFNVLHLAAMKGCTNAVKMILMHRPDLLNVAKSDGFTALHLASVNNRIQTAEMLVQVSGIELDARDVSARTPLHHAGELRHTALVKLLLRNGANPNRSDSEKNTAYRSASKCDNTTKLGKDLLISSGDCGDRDLPRRTEGDEKTKLMQKLQELENELSCKICMERRKEVVFLCGHGSCRPCSESLAACHLCRGSVAKIVHLY